MSCNTSLLFIHNETTPQSVSLSLSGSPLSLLPDLDIQYRAELNRDPEVDKVKVVTQCYNFIEASSNAADIHKMTNGETVTFWQSDGSARSHWIR